MKKSEAMRTFPALTQEDFNTLFHDEAGFFLTEELRQRAYQNAQRKFNSDREAARMQPLIDSEKEFAEKVWRTLR